MRSPRLVLNIVVLSLCMCYVLGVGHLVAGIRFDSEPNTRLAQTPDAVPKANAHADAWRSYARSPAFRVGDGVVPRGTATFVLGDKPNATAISANDIDVRVEKPKQLFNNTVEYDSFHVIYRNKAYNLDTDDEIFCRLVSFVNRDAFLLFTWPAAMDEEAVKVLQDEGMVKGSRVFLRYQYIAKEFNAKEYYEFLYWVDVLSETTPLPNDTEKNILSKINESPIVVDATLEWINADFHVDYLVMLVSDGAKSWVDIAGAPLRYHWKKKAKNELSVREIEIFAMPRTQKRDALQYRAVALFQAAALLREFKAGNPAGFATLAKHVDDMRRITATPSR